MRGCGEAVELALNQAVWGGVGVRWSTERGRCGYVSKAASEVACMRTHVPGIWMDQRWHTRVRRLARLRVRTRRVP
jgi:hypothetical protein